MRCRVCSAEAGWWRRKCAVCGRLFSIFVERRGASLSEFLDAFLEAGATPRQIECFLDHVPEGGGATVRDHIAADMTNQLLAAMGRPPSQQPGGVRRLREKGDWQAYDRRPEDPKKL